MKELTRREFLRIVGVAGAGVVLSKVPAPEVKEEIPKAIDAKLFIDDVDVLMEDMGGYPADLSDEAIEMLMATEPTIIGKEYTITSVSPYFPDDEWLRMPIRFFPDKDSPEFYEGRIVDYDPYSGVVTAEFNNEFRKKLNEAAEDSKAWNELIDNKT